MYTVKEILDTKGREIYSISPDTLVFDALKYMAEKDVGAVVVVENDKIAGMFTERDYARKVILRGKSSKESNVSEFMTKRIFFVEPNTTTNECMAIMTDKRTRHLPVMENGKLIGIISIGDVVNKIIIDQRNTIQYLENYIIGG